MEYAARNPAVRIRVSDYEPAFDAAIAVSRAEIDAIVNNPAKPTFNNTIVALDRQGRLLSRVEGIFFNLLEADATPEMQQVAENVQPKLTALSNDISLNPQLFERVKAVYEHPGWFLSKEDKKLLEETYNGFVRSGANLSDEDKERYAIMEKVGMSNDEVKKSITSQVRMVFFLPIILAACHLAAAFPLLRRLLVMFNLTDVKLIVICMVATLLVFMVIYYIVFKITSRAYYRIVGNQI